MKAVRLSLVIMAAALLTFGVSGLAYAFHSGGVAECEGCHSMHSPIAAGVNLLVGTTGSEACLTCHEHETDTGPSSYHISTATADLTTTPLQRTPGGDFAWLKKTFTYTYNGSTFTETGGGHKINAPVNGYPQASGTAPGGTFQSANLGCESCHDPHGKYRRLSTGAIATTGEPIKASGSYNNTTTNEPVAPGSTTSGAVGVYRILAGTGYATEGSGAIAYPGVPAAKAPSTYNQTETTNQVRVAYGVIAGSGHTTWGNWCGTCHASFHSTGNYVHPVDQGLGTTLATYNAYVKSGDMSGSTASSYLSLVPFASNGVTYVALSGLARNNSPFGAGPTNGDQVTCLSCHRAHASGFSHMLRFDQGYEFMTKGSQYIGSDNPEVGTGGRGPLQSRGRTNADWQAAYYDRPATQFATYQRVLCNKCHAKD